MSVDGKAPTVLFVCGQNAARSQMAAALFKKHAGADVIVRSAGLKAAPELNQDAVKVLEEVGARVEKGPTQITSEIVDAADIIVAVGCGAEHAEFKGKRVIDWKVPDPKGQPIETVREIRDTIDGLAASLSHNI